MSLILRGVVSRLATVSNTGKRALSMLGGTIVPVNEQVFIAGAGSMGLLFAHLAHLQDPGKSIPVMTARPLNKFVMRVSGEDHDIPILPIHPDSVGHFDMGDRSIIVSSTVDSLMASIARLGQVNPEKIFAATNSVLPREGFFKRTAIIPQNMNQLLIKAGVNSRMEANAQIGELKFLIETLVGPEGAALPAIFGDSIKVLSASDHAKAAVNKYFANANNMIGALQTLSRNDGHFVSYPETANDERLRVQLVGLLSECMPLAKLVNGPEFEGVVRGSLTYSANAFVEGRAHIASTVAALPDADKRLDVAMFAHTAQYLPVGSSIHNLGIQALVLQKQLVRQQKEQALNSVTESVLNYRIQQLANQALDVAYKTGQPFMEGLRPVISDVLAKAPRFSSKV
jgi:hypothetical protein